MELMAAKANAHLLRGLNFLPGLEQIEEMTYSAYRHPVDAVVQTFTALGVWGHPHSWFDVLLSAPVVVARGPIAVRLAKQAVLAAFEMTLEEGLEMERKNFFLLGEGY